MVKDSEHREFSTPGAYDAMILRAWDVKDGSDTSSRIFAWEVIVLRTNDHRRPSPEHVGILIRHAAERLAAGWPDESAATAESPEASSNESAKSPPATPPTTPAP